MTAAFNEFLRQYNLTGREKADGYSPDVFIGLNEIEKHDYQIILGHLNSERTEDKIKALSGLKYYEENLDF